MAYTLVVRGSHLGDSIIASSRLSLINRLRPENTKYPIIFSRKHPRPPSLLTLDGEGSEALPDTLPEGEIITGGIYTTMSASVAFLPSVFF